MFWLDDRAFLSTSFCFSRLFGHFRRLLIGPSQKSHASTIFSTLNMTCLSRKVLDYEHFYDIYHVKPNVKSVRRVTGQC